MTDDEIATIFEQIGATFPLLRTINKALSMAVEKMHPNESTLTASQRYPHGKIVACPIVTQSVINAYAGDFNIENAQWELCTVIIVLDNQFIGIEGMLQKITR